MGGNAIFALFHYFPRKKCAMFNWESCSLYNFQQIVSITLYRAINSFRPGTRQSSVSREIRPIAYYTLPEKQAKAQFTDSE